MYHTSSKQTNRYPHQDFLFQKKISMNDPHFMRLTLLIKMFTKQIFFIHIFGLVSLHLLSCNQTSNKNYKGYETVIQSDLIIPVPSIKNSEIIQVSIPKEDSLEFEYNNYLEDISFVKLETSAKSKINNIDKIIISNDRIIISEKTPQNKVFIFNRNGDFINFIGTNNTIHKDQVRIDKFLDVTYDFTTNEIILHNQSVSKLYYFDKNGYFKNIKKEYIYFYQFANIPGTDEYLYVNSLGGNNHLPKLKNSSLYIGNKDTQIRFIANDALKGMKTDVSYIINKQPSITNSNYKMFYTPDFSNRVYRVFGKKGIKEELNINLPTPNTFEKLKNPKNHSIDAFTKLINSGQYYYFTGGVLSNDQDIYFIPTYRVGMSGYFYSKKANSIIGGGTLSHSSQKDTIKITGYQYPISTYKDYFISILYPSDFILKHGKANYKLHTIQTKITPKDNPVIMFYKIKE